MRAASRNDLEPGIAAVLDRRAARDVSAPYRIRRTGDVAASLGQFFASAVPGARVARGSPDRGWRLEGTVQIRALPSRCRAGSSCASNGPRAFGDRDGPAPGIRDTPGNAGFPARPARPCGSTPTARFLANLPASWNSFGGTTKVADHASNLTGIGARISRDLERVLREQFVRNLAAIHAFDWRAAALPSFQAPSGDEHQAARWQVNWWARVWEDSGQHDAGLGGRRALAPGQPAGMRGPGDRSRRLPHRQLPLRPRRRYCDSHPRLGNGSHRRFPRGSRRDDATSLRQLRFRGGSRSAD